MSKFQLRLYLPSLGLSNSLLERRSLITQAIAVELRASYRRLDDVNTRLFKNLLQ